MFLQNWDCNVFLLFSYYFSASFITMAPVSLLSLIGIMLLLKKSSDAQTASVRTARMKVIGVQVFKGNDSSL